MLIKIAAKVLHFYELCKFICRNRIAGRNFMPKQAGIGRFRGRGGFLLQRNTESYYPKSLCIQFVELGFHRGIAGSETFDGHLLQFLIREVEVIAGLDEVLPHFLKMSDGLVYLVDSIGETLVSEAYVTSESVLEGRQFLFEIRHVHLLCFHQSQLSFGVQALLARLAKQRNQRDEERER